MPETRPGAQQLRDFGVRLRGARMASGVSQERLGELAGLHRTYIGHLERGEINPSLLNVLKVARALKVSVGALLDDLNKPSL